MNILFLSHTPMGGTFVVGSHQMAKGYASQGHHVVHLSPPVTPAHLSLIRQPFERERLRRWLRGGAMLHGVRDIIPAAWLTWGMARRLGQPYRRYGQALYRSALHQLKGFQPDLIFIDEPRLGYLLKAFPNAKVTYRPTDVYAEIRRDPSIESAERAVIARADAFIATSEPVARHIRSLGATEVLVLENGVDLAHFVDGHDVDVDHLMPPTPRAVYAGALDHRFGIDSLLTAARENPQASFIVIGPTGKQIEEQVAAVTNITLMGAIDYQVLPSYLRRCQIALLPLSDAPANRGRSPMKIFEYAALGLPIVASATEELERRGLNFVRVAHSPKEFSFQVAQILSDGLPSHRDEAIAFARSQNWLHKCDAALTHTMKVGSA